LAKILAVQSFKGGTGKSTVSANLAVTLARLGKRVAVIDLDLEGPGLHVIFGISDGEIRATINDVLQSSIPVNDAVLDLTPRLGIESGCLLFCPAGHRLEEILKMVDTGFNLSRFKAVLYNLATEYRLDYLLIDSHPGIEKDTILSMAVCDVVVLLSRVDHQDMFGSGVMNEVASQLRKPVILILNMIPSSIGERESKKIGEKIASLFNLQVLTALPFNSDVFENLSRGVFVLEHQKDPLTKRFTEMAENMIAIIDQSLDAPETSDNSSTQQSVS
jgi:MinD-like ATPase involved in chromosome partitioning or flagellar assembly